MTNDPLDQLRDIQTSEGLIWWPLAIGWWVLITLFILALIGAYLYFKKKNKVETAPVIPDIDIYKQNFQAIEQDYNDSKNNLKLVQDCSMLLRKITSQQNPTSTHLTGNDWLEALNAQFDTVLFTEEYASVFTQANYAPSVNINAESLLQFMQCNLSVLEESLPEQKVRKDA